MKVKRSSGDFVQMNWPRHGPVRQLQRSEKCPRRGAGGTQWQVLHSWFQILYCTIIPIKTYHRYTFTNLCQQALLCLPDCKMMQRGFSQSFLGTLRCYSHAIWCASVTLGYAILGDGARVGYISVDISSVQYGWLSSISSILSFQYFLILVFTILILFKRFVPEWAKILLPLKPRWSDRSSTSQMKNLLKIAHRFTFGASLSLLKEVKQNPL